MRALHADMPVWPVDRTHGMQSGVGKPYRAVHGGKTRRKPWSCPVIIKNPPEMPALAQHDIYNKISRQSSLLERRGGHCTKQVDPGEGHKSDDAQTVNIPNYCVSLKALEGHKLAIVNQACGSVVHV